MKIAFTASLYEKEVHRFHYLAIINLLEGLGHTVLYSHLTQFDIGQVSQSENHNTLFHRMVFQALKSADLIVIEVTHQSLSGGYIIAEAIKNQKPVLVLTNSKTPPLTTFLEKSDKLLVHQYSTIRELEQDLPFLLSQIEFKKEKKFNFFLSSKLSEYLLQASNKKRVSKSEYLRQLLKNDQKHLL